LSADVKLEAEETFSEMDVLFCLDSNSLDRDAGSVASYALLDHLVPPPHSQDGVVQVEILALSSQGPKWVTVEAAKLLVSMKAAGEDGGGMWIVSSDHRKSSTAAAEAEAEQERSARHSDDRGAMESLSPLRRSSHWHSSPDLTKLALLRSTSSKSLDGNRGGDRSEPGVGTAQLASRNLEAQEAEEGGRELAIDSMVARACVLGKPIDLEDLGPNGRSFEQLHLLFGLSQCARNSLL